MKTRLILTGLAVAAALTLLVIQFPATGDAQTRPGSVQVEVILPDLSPEASIGARVFAARCVACHGENAAGNDEAGPPLIHKFYEPSHHGDGAIFQAARFGARAHHWRFGDMPPVEGITDAEIGYVVAYIREVQRANGIR